MFWLLASGVPRPAHSSVYGGYAVAAGPAYGSFAAAGHYLAAAGLPLVLLAATPSPLAKALHLTHKAAGGHASAISMGHGWLFTGRIYAASARMGLEAVCIRALCG
ncbi:MAG: hypothetical protein NC489_41895 [Ruminococcus flavefaciens]|nr:hypothetical protein [Ruminococcus flavefaciens]